MAFNFPNTPTEGQIFTDATSGAQYVYRGTVWMQSSAAQINLGAQTRNRICNPAMQISQENGNTSSTAASYYVADQWQSSFSTTGTVTFQRVQLATPNKSVNRIRATITVADISIAAGEYLQLLQPIEGTRVADFAWGTASARQAILRFGLKAPAGSYGIAVRNSAANRTYAALITITAGQANTDTEQTLIIPGDIAGTWLTDNGVGMYLTLCLACGTTNTAPSLGWQAGNFIGAPGMTNGMATGAAVFELFDVGLYLDPQATGAAPPWQMPDEAQELRACKRYWNIQPSEIYNGYFPGASVGYSTLRFAEEMRTQPTIAFSGLGYSNCSGLAVNGGANFKNAQLAANTLAGAWYVIYTATMNARM